MGIRARIRGPYRLLRRDWASPAALVELNLKVTTRCNLACPMCARTQIGSQRPSVDLDPGVLASWIRGFPSTVERVAIAGLGEPLLHPELPAIVGMLARAGLTVDLYTNGTLLDPQRSQALLEAGLRSVYIAVDGATQETYGRYRSPASLDRTREGILALLEAKGRLGVDCWVELQLILLPETRGEVDAWRRQWNLPGIDGLRVKSDQMEVFDPGRAPRDRGVCPMPWRGPATVDVFGQVHPCCVQAPGNILGRLGEATVEQLWNGESARALRRGFARTGSKQPGCQGCRVPIPPW